MKKVLFVSNHAGFSKFNAPYMEWFHNKGWQVDNVSPGVEIGYFDNQYDLPIKRNPFSLMNLRALLQLRKICKLNDYDLIHCHTPVGGVLGRLCVSPNSKTKILYTAHGFHFFKGAKSLNWVLFYPIEKILAKRTDAIVTINQEDYDLATRKFNVPVYKINGVGVNLQRFVPVSIEEKYRLRRENDFPDDAFVLVYCAQFIPRKNHLFLINQAIELKKKIPNLMLCFVGTGVNESKIKDYCEAKGVTDYVRFMGYRTDVQKLYAMSDILVSSSLQEGFGINLVEGMACALPIVCSDVRGHRDILEMAKNNFLFKFDDNSFSDSILLLFQNKQLYEEVSKTNINNAKLFSIENSIQQMSVIYEKYM